MQDFMGRRHLGRIMEHGFYGVICSARDIGMLSGADPNRKLKRVCPGITFGVNLGGQVRGTTPKQALDYGAVYIVVGRLVTESSDPIATIKKISNVINPKKAV